MDNAITAGISGGFSRVCVCGVCMCLCVLVWHTELRAISNNVQRTKNDW